MMARRWYICCMKFRFLGLQCYAGPNLSCGFHDLYRMALPMIFRMASRCSLLNLAKFSFNPFVHAFRLFDFLFDWQRINWINSSKFSNLLERFKYSSSSAPLFQVHTIQNNWRGVSGSLKMGGGALYSAKRWWWGLYENKVRNSTTKLTLLYCLVTIYNKTFKNVQFNMQCYINMEYLQKGQWELSHRKFKISILVDPARKPILWDTSLNFDFFN